MVEMLPLDPRAMAVLLDALADVDALNARARGRRAKPLAGSPGAADLDARNAWHRLTRV
jgi:hypothetical protein